VGVNMPYQDLIRTTENKCKAIDHRLYVINNDENFSKDTLLALTEERTVLYNELSRLRRLQWEEDNERVEIDDRYRYRR
jgi:hypothetical protein